MCLSGLSFSQYSGPLDLTFFVCKNLSSHLSKGPFKKYITRENTFLITPLPSMSLFVTFLVEFVEIFSIPVLQNNSKHPLTKLIKKYSRNNYQNVYETSKVHIVNFESFLGIFGNNLSHQNKTMLCLIFIRKDPTFSKLC